MLNQFYIVSGLRPNSSKCEIVGIGSLKDAKVALCGLKSLDLTKESIKILGVHISYNKKLQDDINFCMTVKNICNVIKLWRMRHLSPEGKITIFKSLALSKIVYLALLTIVPKSIIEKLNEIQKKFLWSQIKNVKLNMVHPTSLVSSQFLGYNSYIKIDKEVVCYKEFADKKINFVSDLFDENGKLKSWQKILSDFQLTQKSYFKWFQLIHAIPRPWKLAVLNDKGN